MRSLLLVTSTLLLAACSRTADKLTPDAGAASGASLSCHIADQDRCVEAPAPTKAQEEAQTIECSSTSGVLKRPAACPTAGFVGRCTIVESGTTTVRRWYKGADAAYQKSFCVETVKGTWSAAF